MSERTVEADEAATHSLHEKLREFKEACVKAREDGLTVQIVSTPNDFIANIMNATLKPTVHTPEELSIRVLRVYK